MKPLIAFLLDILIALSFFSCVTQMSPTLSQQPQATDTSGHIFVHASSTPLQAMTTVQKDLTMYLNFSLDLSDPNCGQTPQQPCYSIHHVFDIIQDSINTDITNQILLPINNNTLYNYNITVVLMRNSVHDDNCFIYFGFEYPELENRVHLSISFTSFPNSNNERYEMTCNADYATLFSLNGFSNTAKNFIRELNLHRVAFNGVRWCFNRIAHSVLSNNDWTCIEKVSPYNSRFIQVSDSTLENVEFKVAKADDVSFSDSKLTAFGYISKSNSFIISNCTMVQPLSSSKYLSISNTLSMKLLKSTIHIRHGSLMVQMMAVQNFEMQQCELFFNSGESDPMLRLNSYIFDLKIALSVTIRNLNIYGFRNSLFYLSSIGNAIIENVSFLNGKSSGDDRPVFNFNIVTVLDITNLTMSNNIGGCMKISNSQSITILNSNFDKNVKNGNGAVIEAECEKLTVVNSFFSYNQANGTGGAISITSTTGISVTNSHFIGNSASKSGGAIGMTLSSSNLNIDPPTKITNSSFIENSALSSSPVTWCKGFYDCMGSGGAVALASRVPQLFTSTFMNNKASWGGAMVFQSDSILALPVTRVTNNHAHVAGGAVFFMTPLLSKDASDYGLHLENNIGALYGNDYASSICNVSSLMVRLYDLKQENYKPLENLQQVMHVYLGQLVSIRINNMKDCYEQNIPIFRETLSLVVSNIEKHIQYESMARENGTDIRFTQAQNTFQNANFSLTVSLNVWNFTFSVLIVPCPNGWEYRDGICKEQLPLGVIISFSIIGFLLAILIGIFFGVLFSKLVSKMFVIKGKLKKLETREKEEKKIEQKLLNSELGEIQLEEDITKSNSSFLTTKRNLSSTISKNSTKSSSSRPQNAATSMSYIIPVEDLVVIKKIAEGGYGTIYLARCWGTTDVAVKSFHQNDDTMDDEEFEKEVSVLVNLRNPYIVTFYGVCITENRKFMVLEYMQKGSLQNLIYNCRIGKEVLTLKLKINILLDISCGMKYLHSMKPALVHRDLKPANILINEMGQHKVCDFGLSRMIPTNSLHSMFTSTVGTMYYMAPELILEQEHSITRDLLTKIDVYSFAIIMWELFFEENPYLNDNVKKLHCFPKAEKTNITPLTIFVHIAKEELRPIIPFNNREELSQWSDMYLQTQNNVVDKNLLLETVEKYIELMKQCWAHHPSERPSFEQIFVQLSNLKNTL
ncbi:hypothetical protein C9374_012918 [Naegleria lovaniensis]|uniref:Protein kinase domain-containing protein n=1 Tax=Naegleria lovaniensis TaxID=51637 RepID=A0AA88KHP4_NAELO|nr:uncharacterized protein C9374_012918 [Naegleria lovaniensis]KAG2373072.1 hypothetical protein C9374_012918 [Naegleria lovaniensis]